MNGILIVDKEANMTSRDVVNKIVKKFNTKKVGHTGTLDPIATGVLVVCVGNATKLVDRLTCLTKEYIATVKLGILTDTLDNTGNIIKREDVNVTKEEITEALAKFRCTYTQEVPIYSAVKVNGKKLYEYAREGKTIDLPKREVTIKNIELLEFNNDTFKFKCLVSKGTYIRSLINDICKSLNTIGIMTDLRRTKQGNFLIEKACKVDDITLNNLMSIKDILSIKTIELTSKIEKQVLNGAKIINTYNLDEALFTKDNKEIGIYKKDGDYLKADIMFGGNL